MKMGQRGWISGLRGQIQGLRGPGGNGWTDKRTDLLAQILVLRLKSPPRGSNPSLNKHINKQMKVPCSTGHRSLWRCCPANHHLQSQTYKAGQWVSLTTYSPWATGKALRMAFFTAVLVRVRNTSKPFFGFITGLYRVFK